MNSREDRRRAAFVRSSAVRRPLAAPIFGANADGFLCQKLFERARQHGRIDLPSATPSVDVVDLAAVVPAAALRIHFLAIAVLRRVAAFGHFARGLSVRSLGLAARAIVADARGYAICDVVNRIDARGEHRRECDRERNSSKSAAKCGAAASGGRHRDEGMRISAPPVKYRVNIKRM
jgi:hypothetical protein